MKGVLAMSHARDGNEHYIHDLLLGFGCAHSRDCRMIG